MCTVGLQNNTTLPELSHNDDYCCDFSDIESLEAGFFSMPSNASCNLSFGSHYFPSFSEESKLSINPMAGLSLVPFAHAAQNLFMRGAPFIIPMHVIFIFLIVFFLLAAVTAGSAIPSGLLLPQILIGSMIGRLVTLIIISIQLQMGWHASATKQNSIWSPEYTPFFSYSGGPLKEDAVLTVTTFPEPGIGAIIGAAAFLGGSGRIAVFIVVMLVEITGDPLIILPVGVATMTAV